MRVQVLLLLVLASYIGNINATDVDTDYTLYLVRHAEKQTDGSDDPALNDIGRNRSEQLATWFEEKDIKLVWSSDYRRSRDTAGPLISGLGLELNLYDPRDLPSLTKTLLDNRSNALVVGHSNTTPELARLLCQCVISDYRRSRDTAGPLISGLGLELSLYDPRDLPSLTKTLLDNRSNALVVGHSNTTPELARLLCQCVITEMDDSEYERLIVVSFSGDEVTVDTLIQNTLFQP